jgi:exodeoxyribonuclease VII large subunit
VQGEGAAAQIAATIATAGRRGECDVLLVARGGGSLEDLWAFNDEAVARAIRACPMPVVAGIGHETDTSIADMAADLRAATPTAAAELASAGWHAAAEEIAGLALALKNSLHQTLEQRMQAVDLLARRLIHPAEQLARTRQRLAHLATRLTAALGRQFTLEPLRRRPPEFHAGAADHEAARNRLLRAEQGLHQATTARLARQRARSTSSPPHSRRSTRRRCWSAATASCAAPTATSFATAPACTPEKPCRCASPKAMAKLLSFVQFPTRMVGY